MVFIMYQELTEPSLKIQRRFNVLTGNLYGEVPSKILNVGENQAEEALFGGKKHLEMICMWSLCVTIKKMKIGSIQY